MTNSQAHRFTTCSKVEDLILSILIMFWSCSIPPSDKNSIHEHASTGPLQIHDNHHKPLTKGVQHQFHEFVSIPSLMDPMHLDVVQKHTHDEIKLHPKSETQYSGCTFYTICTYKSSLSKDGVTTNERPIIAGKLVARSPS